MESNEYKKDQTQQLLDEKYEEIRQLVQAIRDVYAIAGEEECVAKICNRVLENTSITGIV